ncbi:hypothetical protein EJ05DRAFT_534361 [Pseudovirgaria hyperparasitica]|uniref:F-box domain-containing protein n=1 Tax=Pseudovirgaria hyperparasitica TaxID=470096 RepID=A0A6A6WL40_9PEZI|nr:uncharacterized protein EJ05DRAFT_534361 [Pseudovirgaria hyperparasitica]KAF2762897.1 hypothetical protein EJ05DRAFT_534361 [Pseudovirgaria hyperparasitica]
MARTAQTAPKVIRQDGFSKGPTDTTRTSGHITPRRNFGTPSAYNATQHGKGLMDLPIDIFRLLISELPPDDYVAFMMTCKSLFTIGEFRVDHHMEMTHRYQFACFPPERNAEFVRRDEVPSTKASEFLSKVAREPEILDYIRYLDMNSDQLHVGEEIWSRDNVYGGLEKTRENLWRREAETGALRKLLDQNWYLKQASQNIDKWLDAMKDVGEFHAEVCLLTLLPNVKELCLPSEWTDVPEKYFQRIRDDEVVEADCDAGRVLRLIATQANKARSIEVASLAKLERLIPWCEIAHDVRPFMSSVTPFIAINSMKQWTARGLIALDDGYTGFPFQPQFDQFSVNLSEVTLQGCILGGDEAFNLTSRLPALRSFEYSHDVKWHGCGYAWAPGEVMEGLINGCGDRLEVLNLHTPGTDEPGIIEASIRDMKGMTKLKRLSLDVRMFHESDNNSPVDSEEEDEMLPFLESLPRTLENLLLRARKSDIEMFDWILADWDEKDKVLLALKTFNVELSESESKVKPPKGLRKLRHKLDDCGIIVTDV